MCPNYFSGTSVQRLVFPTRLQFFGSLGHDCSKIVAPHPWFPLTPLITITSKDELEFPAVNDSFVDCLKLTVFEMSHGGLMAIGGLKAEEKILPRMEKKYFDKKWSDSSLDLDFLCQDTQEYERQMLSNQGQYVAKNDDSTGINYDDINNGNNNSRHHHYHYSTTVDNDENNNSKNNINNNRCQARSFDKFYTMTNSYIACQCDAYCIRFGDCCSDANVNLDRLNFEVVLENHRVECFPTQFPNSTRFPTIGFYLIKSCQIGYKDSHVRDLCLQDKETNVSIKSQVPVTIGDRTYRNMYCAQCNGENVTEDYYWSVNFRNYNCRQNWRNDYGGNEEQQQICQDDGGLAYPKKEDIFSGHSRLGKLCFMNDKSTPPYALTHTQLASNPRLLMLTLNGFQAVPRECICLHCQGLGRFLSTDYSVISTIFSRAFNFVTLQGYFYGTTNNNGLIKTIFDKTMDKDENETEIAGNVTTKESSTMRVISLTGSGSSTFFLFLLFLIQLGSSTSNSEARRCQLGIIFSKLLLFLSLSGATALRNILAACKFFAVSTHYFMLVSFGQMMWFSSRVAVMLWKVNHDLAALANGKQGLGCFELGIFIGIWFGGLCLMILFWLLDALVDDTLFQYGRNRICLMAGDFGQLYFVVVPTTIMVVFNAGGLIFSLIQLSQAWNKPLDQRSFFDYVKFLGKMTAFQSFQWIFGIVYYLASSPVAGMIFEFLVAYEGIFIAVFFLVAKWQLVKQKYNNWKERQNQTEDTQSTDQQRAHEQF